MANDDPLAIALGEVRQATRDQVTAVWQAQMERMRDVLSRDWREQMCRVIDERFADFETSLKPRLLEARREVVRSFGRHWNECFLRMRDAETDREWCDALLDAVGGLSKRCLFFSVKGETVCFQGARGFDYGLHEIPGEIAIQAAPAFVEVALTGVAAETTRTARDLPPALGRLVGDPAAKALLLPVSAGERVAAIVYVENALEQAALEAIALVAGILLARRLSVAEAPRPSSIVRAGGDPIPHFAEPEPAAVVVPAAAPASVEITEPVQPEARPERKPENPQAERAARVAVARLLLDHYRAVRAGREAGDAYSPVKTEIDRLRQDFQYPSPVLEAELLRSLAQGRPELTGR